MDCTAEYRLNSVGISNSMYGGQCWESLFLFGLCFLGNFGYKKTIIVVQRGHVSYAIGLIDLYDWTNMINLAFLEGGREHIKQ